MTPPEEAKLALVDFRMRTLACGHAGHQVTNHVGPYRHYCECKFMAHNVTKTHVWRTELNILLAAARTGAT